MNRVQNLGTTSPFYAENSCMLQYSAAFLENARQLAFNITGKFEGGKANSLQLKDAGIISYGKHQATLKSGALYDVIEQYRKLSYQSTGLEFTPYMTAIKAADSRLRDDPKFIDLLLRAALDPQMSKAQDIVFTDSYWKPVVRKAEELGLKSEIGLAILYDTNIQGGLASVLSRTESLNRQCSGERQFLDSFLTQRSKYLNEIARKKRAGGDEFTARVLERDAVQRIAKLRQLLLRANLENIAA